MYLLPVVKTLNCIWPNPKQHPIPMSPYFLSFWVFHLPLFPHAFLAARLDLCSIWVLLVPYQFDLCLFRPEITAKSSHSFEALRKRHRHRHVPSWLVLWCPCISWPMAKRGQDSILGSWQCWQNHSSAHVERRGGCVFVFTFFSVFCCLRLFFWDFGKWGFVFLVFGRD